MKPRILIVHAHPDDELLFMGGFLLRYRDNFKVDFACLTFPFNKTRLKGLFRLDKYFDVGMVMCFGYEDDTAVWREGAAFHFDNIWVECLDFEKYDLVFSHNQFGEYYHPHHVYVHETLKSAGIPFVSFGHLGEFNAVFKLTEEEIRRKQETIRDLYPSEFGRCIHKFSYWDTDRERFRFEGEGMREKFERIFGKGCEKLDLG